MAQGQGHGSAVLRQLQTLFNAGAVGAASDGQLLERFSRRENNNGEAEAAFAVLVARHGPMVLGVCRRSLRNPEDVADAFQATFLVLVRKAGSVRVRDSLGRWLYGVSRRVAARARVEAARRASRETTGQEIEPEVPAEDFGRLEMLKALDEEVSRLPEPFRAAVVLCDLHGLTHEAAARQFGCPVGTVESRLSRGREKLRERLGRRGFATPVAFQGLVPSVVPEALSATTVRCALARWASSPSVASLLDGVLKEMLFTKLKMVIYGVVVVGFCGIGVVAAQKASTVDKPVVAPKVEPKPAALAPTAKIKPGDRLIIEVLEALPGRPISGERLVRPDGTISLGYYGDVQVAGLDRNEIKVLVVNHLIKFLDDDILGLVELNGETGKLIPVAPIDSNRVFVDDSLNNEPAVTDNARTMRRFDRILGAIENDAPKIDPIMMQFIKAQDQRLIVIEKKLDRLIEALEKGEGK